MNIITINQSLNDLKINNYSYAYEDWIKKTDPLDKLPRGNYFKNRKGSYTNLVLIDEFPYICWSDK